MGPIPGCHPPLNPMALRLLLDSADPLEWERWLPSGLFQGITTNPTMLRRASQPCSLDHLASLSRRAAALGCRELHLQTWGVDGSSSWPTAGPWRPSIPSGC